MTDGDKKTVEIGEGGLLTQDMRESAAQPAAPGAESERAEWQDLLEGQQELYRNRDRVGGPDHNC